MRLLDLEPAWELLDWEEGQPLPTMETAQGVSFLCPYCFQKNKGPVGTHGVLCWFRDRGVPDGATPGPGRWTPTGTGFENLSLTPSVDLTAQGKHPDEWHGWITNGEVF